MDGRAVVTDKAEAFLRGLTPRARGMLVRRMESDRAAPTELEARRRLILEAARAIAESRDAARHAMASPPADMRRLVFAALEPYVIEERLVFPARGFVTAATLSHLWSYAANELQCAEVAAWSDPETAPSLPNDAARRQEAVKLEGRLFDVLAKHIAAIADEPKLQQRFMSRIGGEVARREIDDMIAVRDRLEDLPTLSAAIVHLLDTGPADMALLEQIATYLAKYPNTAGWVAAGVFRRQATVAPLIAFAKLLARGETARRVRATPAATAFVDLGLAAADRSASRFQTILRGGRNAADATAQIGVFRSTLNELTTGLDIDNDGGWQPRLLAIKRRFSDMLFVEFDKLLSGPGRRRRSGLPVRRVRGDRQIARHPGGQWPDRSPDAAGRSGDRALCPRPADQVARPQRRGANGGAVGGRLSDQGCRLPLRRGLRVPPSPKQGAATEVIEACGVRSGRVF
jgi:hypothetical protein